MVGSPKQPNETTRPAAPGDVGGRVQARTRSARLVLVTGMPASGKTTLARSLADRHGLALIAKDAIKEPLMDVLGSDPSRSRTLSDAAFAVMFRLAKQLLEAGVDVILEGNFRSSEHEAPLLALRRATPVLQLLCTVPEEQRQARMIARADDPGRHPGHRDVAQARARKARNPDTQSPESGPATPVQESGGFLDLPGERLEFPTGEGSQPARDAVLDRLASYLAAP